MATLNALCFVGITHGGRSRRQQWQSSVCVCGFFWESSSSLCVVRATFSRLHLSIPLFLLSLHLLLELRSFWNASANFLLLLLLPLPGASKEKIPRRAFCFHFHCQNQVTPERIFLSFLSGMDVIPLIFYVHVPNVHCMHVHVKTKNGEKGVEITSAKMSKSSSAKYQELCTHARNDIRNATIYWFLI